MTINEFATGYIEEKYGFVVPDKPEKNNDFLNFIGALDQYIPPEWYKWAGNTFKTYVFSGSKNKFIRDENGRPTCTGIMDTKYIKREWIDFRDVDCKDNFEEDYVSNFLEEFLKK